METRHPEDSKMVWHVTRGLWLFEKLVFEVLLTIYVIKWEKHTKY